MHFFLQSFTSTQPFKTTPLTRAQELMEDIANSNAIDNKAYKKNRDYVRIINNFWRLKLFHENLKQQEKLFLKKIGFTFMHQN